MAAMSFLCLASVEHFQNGQRLPMLCVLLCNRFYSQGKIPTTEQKKKKNKGPKITLVGTDDKMSVMFLEDAEKVAKRRDLKLRKVSDAEAMSERPLYKLLSGVEHFKQELKDRKDRVEKRKSEVKGQKMLSLSHKINENDLQSKLKNIKKWLEKNYEARVVLVGNSEGGDSLGKMFNSIKDSVSSYGNVAQKQEKGHEIRFKITPLLKKTDMVASEGEGSRGSSSAL